LPFETNHYVFFKERFIDDYFIKNEEEGQGRGRKEWSAMILEKYISIEPLAKMSDCFFIVFWRRKERKKPVRYGMS